MLSAAEPLFSHSRSLQTIADVDPAALL